ncbi:hypothetical protein [Halorarum salinum]|nr:hypothetical protein [Halobaculum salinum]
MLRNGAGCVAERWFWPAEASQLGEEENVWEAPSLYDEPELGAWG